MTLKAVVERFMKKFAITILALIYLSTSIGVTVHMHYCMNRLAGWGMNNKESNTCSTCGMAKLNPKDKDCCHDKLAFFKITGDQKVTESASKLSNPITFIVPTYYIELPTPTLSLVTEKRPFGDSPPFRNQVPIYILNCDYRI